MQRTSNKLENLRLILRFSTKELGIKHLACRAKATLNGDFSALSAHKVNQSKIVSTLNIEYH